MTQPGQLCIPALQAGPASKGWRASGVRTTAPHRCRYGFHSVLCSARGEVNVAYRYPVLTALILAAVVLAIYTGRGLALSALSVPAAQASTGVTNTTGTTPTAANNVFGSWDDVLSLKIIPLGALAVGLAAIFGGIRAGSGGLIGGGVIAVLAAILTVALPAIVLEASGASLGVVSSGAGWPSPLTPFTPLFYMGLRYVRRLW